MVKILNLEFVEKFLSCSSTSKDLDTPTRNNSRVSPRKLIQCVKNYGEDFDDSITEDDENDDETTSYLCGECNHSIANSIASNRACLIHWVREHGSIYNLRYINQQTGNVLKIADLFQTVAQCRKCPYILGNNRSNACLLRRIKHHWVKEHPEEPECADTEKLEVLDIHGDENEGSVNSDFVDVSLDYIGPFECIVDSCSERFHRNRAGWKMRALNHFLQEHDH